MTETVTARILRLPHAEDLLLPAYETEGSAGMDLRAAVPEDQPMTLAPGARALVPTGVILANLGSEPFVIRRGERIAQMVIARHERVQWSEVKSLDETVRGEGGFGSTGQ